MLNIQISEMSLNELQALMLKDLQEDVTASSCSSEEMLLLHEFFTKCKTPINLFYNIIYFLRKVPSNDTYKLLFNVLQRWRCNWINRLQFDNPNLEYSRKDVLPINDSSYRESARL